MTPQRPDGDRPNILLFVTDDHGRWALPCYGSREIAAPAFDRLASEGVRFDNAFTPCPVCSPARACLLTGRTPSQVGIHDWIQENAADIRPRRWLADEVTLGQLLRDAGYRCGLSGKWHLGQSEQPHPGFDYWFGMLHGQHSHHGKCTFGDNGVLTDFQGNREQIVTDHAIRFLEQSAGARQSAREPWFLHVGYTATHSPYHTQDPAYLARYEGASFDDIPRPAPHPWFHSAALHGRSSEAEHLKQFYRGYYAAVSNIDDGIGRLLEHLESSGQLENTLVIYVSDHGCALGHQGIWGKGNSTRPLNVLETSIRVPLLMRWPRRLPGGAVVERCVDHYDLFQMLCEVGGVDLSRGASGARAYPGRSPLALAEGRDVPDWDDARFAEYGELRMIRTPDWKWVRRWPDGPHELFDLSADPLEERNLADDPAHAATRARLDRRLETFYARHSDAAKSGLRVRDLPRHNDGHEAWRPAPVNA